VNLKVNYLCFSQFNSCALIVTLCRYGGGWCSKGVPKRFLIFILARIPESQTPCTPFPSLSLHLYVNEKPFLTPTPERYPDQLIVVLAPGGAALRYLLKLRSMVSSIRALTAGSIATISLQAFPVSVTFMRRVPA